ncbi:hypothetical protein KY290_028877 [Solanum tuberosum]|uniref:DUF674 domain-containing protein n=1 Tax=Solanum tuberosum TaxID=4113 RepID=A0ABQ7UJ51_SOLTU|nr:PREDICTED: uncharacterized protein LOC107061952 [Solanum tuberosum]KAH0749645.1 hypothetical protein KY290_028877 [Solanum tuberosum]
MATDENKLSMKLLIDTKLNKKVVFAEVEKDFVDFLFYILTLPLSTVTKLLKDKGMNGCLPNIYESVENLNDTYMKSKQLILQPKCPVNISKAPLPLLDGIPTPTALYKCSTSYCTVYVTDDPASCCPNCMSRMSIKVAYADPPGVKESKAATGVFVKDVVKYMVMDDLVVKPLSVSNITALKDSSNIKEIVSLHEEVVQFGKEEALKLLKSSLESKAVLTSVFMSLVKVEK